MQNERQGQCCGTLSVPFILYTIPIVCKMNGWSSAGRKGWLHNSAPITGGDPEESSERGKPREKGEQKWRMLQGLRRKGEARE